MDIVADREKQIRFEGQKDCSVLIDGHVHLHECFFLIELLDAAATNFVSASRDMGLTGQIYKVLLLCDTSAQHSFSDLLRAVESNEPVSGWYFSSQTEPTVISAVRDDDTQLLLIAGRQIQTSDGLEVLALCTNEKIRDGLGTADTIEAAYSAGATAVLPWGFGKWHGKRGALVDQLIQREGAHRLVLGDNSGRLASLREPSQFRAARELQMSILAGTDPLPFPGHQRRVGRYGSFFRGPFDQNNAARSIQSLLHDDLGQLVTYGRGESPLPFLINQAGMQLRKRLSRKPKIT
jgi:hypothetical protein